MYYTPAVLLVPPFTQLFGGLLPSSYSQTNSNPRVELPYSTFEGITIGNVTQFLGIPFAEPPYGLLFALYIFAVLTLLQDPGFALSTTSPSPP